MPVGHLFDAINRLKGNASLLNKPGYFKVKEELLKVSGKTVYEYRKATPKQLAQIRQALINQRRQTFIKSILVFALSVLAAASLIMLMIYWFIL